MHQLLDRNMSNPRPSTHSTQPSPTANQPDRSNGPAIHESILKSLEQEAASTKHNLLADSTQRELDVIDGLKSNADVMDKIIDMISQLMYRVRQLEEVQDKAEMEKTKTGGGCGLNCANNSFTL